jgi:hypothetical protein
MTDLAIKYVANPFSIFFRKLIKAADSMGRARAANHLAQMGYYEEAKHLMLEVDKD